MANGFQDGARGRDDKANGTAENEKFHKFLFGPQFSMRRDRLTPFVHMLLGGSRLDQSGTATFTPAPTAAPIVANFSRSTTNFAFAAGGGADYKLTDKLAWRVQADYLEIGVPNRTLDNFRLQQEW
jgi:opacity protein-like surface antigen